MATIPSTSDQTADLLQNLSLDSQTKTEDAMEGIYGYNGAAMYPQGYGYAHGGHPLSSSPAPTVGQDDQLYHYPGSFYQLPTPTHYTPNEASTSQGEVSIATDQAPLSVGTAKTSTNRIANGGNVTRNNGLKPLRPSNHNPSNFYGSYNMGSWPVNIPSMGYHDPRFGYDGFQSVNPWVDASMFSDGQPGFSSSLPHASNLPSGSNQNFQPLPHLMNLHPARPTSGLGQTSGSVNRMYPDNRMYSQYGSTYRAGAGIGSFGYNSWTGERGWLAVNNKYKPRSRGNGAFGYGNENTDSLAELNKGPRAKDSKNQRDFVPITLASQEQDIPMHETKKEDHFPLVQDKKQYNGEDFPDNYSDAKFFVIKSYSEDDVHKSIKYSVWASTPKGNKKLDAAYHEAKEKAGYCPVFLLFSVNTSGQFVGLAEMVGPVDFNRTVEYWQQDKWIGCFPLKWLVIKDIPNSSLRHITLENNENKPVTNSRDTQEVNFEQGMQILKIFKGYSSKTCILDDFGFYESRQRVMQGKKAKQQLAQKKVLDARPDDAVQADDKDRTVEEGGMQTFLDAALIKQPVVAAVAASGETNGELKPFEESRLTPTVEDTPKDAKSVVLSK